MELHLGMDCLIWLVAAEAAVVRTGQAVLAELLGVVEHLGSLVRMVLVAKMVQVVQVVRTEAVGPAVRTEAVVQADRLV